MAESLILLLDRYLWRHILPPLAGVVGVALLSLSLERLLRLTRMITNEGAAVGRAFELLGYLLPHYLGMALSVGLFIAVLIGVRRMYEHSELVVYFSSGGISMPRLLRPVALASAACMLVLLLLVAYVQPHSRHAYRAALWDVRKTGILTNFQPGTFERVAKNTVIRAEQVGQKQGALGRFFVSAEPENGQRVIMVAEHARLPAILSDEEMSMPLKHGQILYIRPNQPPLLIGFGDYPWKLPISAEDTYGARGQDARELTLVELAAGRLPFNTPFKPGEARAELHARLAQVLAVPLFALLAVPLALLGRGRAGRAYGLAIGLVAYILYQQLADLAKALAAKGELSPWLGIWGVVLLLALGVTAACLTTLNVTPLRRRLGLAGA